MKLVVGLGNPGKDYENTRHNIGFMVLDFFVQSFSLEKKFQALIKKEKVLEEDVLFVKPLMFMNLSGESVLKIVKYYHINIEDILVIHDDLDLDFGKVKLKKNSSSGGHNGIKSIIKNLNSQEFCRLKIGIGNNKNIKTTDYVLQKFSFQEMYFLEANYSFYKEIIESFIINGAEKTMNEYNAGGKLHG